MNRAYLVKLLFVNHELNRIMHAFDLWEGSRRLIHHDAPMTMEIILKPRVQLAVSFKKWLKALQKQDEYPLIAIWVPGHPGLCWRDEKVLTVSTGYQFTQTMKLLEAHGWPG